MLAKKEAFYSKDRTPLADVIPLNTPYKINLEFSSACNLRCRFCGHSSDDFLRDFHHSAELMSNEDFDILLSQLSYFPKKIKAITICGYGEPLLNPHTPGFISALKEKQVAERIEMFTNGLMLNHTLSEKLVKSGLDRIQLSVNGLSGEDYLQNTGRKIDFAAFLDEIKYLFSVKGNMSLDIKIVDVCIPHGDEQRFYDIFGNYCDRISVEKAHLVVNTREKSYGEISDRVGASEKWSGFSDRTFHVCPLPFYSMTVRASGSVGLCNCVSLEMTSPELNFKRVSILDIWNGSIRNGALLKILHEDYSELTEKCKYCVSRSAFAFQEDCLDHDVDRLIDIIMKQEIGNKS